ncbi:piggyBac transposable element-derived protein 3-like, partial [Nilaparvata lugens]|uniref:piggyBac transposable element-derived protein 3-like n=1 Tax=Nilaparvata lugens TaxID=108931 RepID=UPI00193C917C
MVPFKGSLDMKQYIRNKPTKWGVKIFVLCGESGTMFDFLIYQGSTTEVKSEYTQFGLGAAVVMQLSERLPQFFQIYFDNFFSTYPLFQWLIKKEIYAVGTIRVDRFCKPPLKTDSEMKKLPRGSVDEVVSKDEIILTKWSDNSCVTLGSNFIGKGEFDTCRRWDKKQNRYIDVPRPQCVQLYNASMGGVDKLDFLVALYRTFIRSKKWTLRMFTHALDLAVTNSWLEYRKESARQQVPSKEMMDLIHFRQYVSEALIVGGRQPTKKRGRPSSTEEATTAPLHHKRVAAIKPVMEVRYDGMHHLPEVSEKEWQDRCMNEGCT